MRIVGGKHRGRTIKGPPKKQQLNTRPTTDRVRESLFNIIAPRIRGANFLIYLQVLVQLGLKL